MLIRIIKNRLFLGAIVLFSIFSIIPLFLILFFIFKNGISSLDFLFTSQILNAIVGTFILIILAGIFSIPLGILAGIYLSESKGRLVYFVRLCVEVLQGIPSIVIGIIAYLLIVVPMKGFSAISGGFALGIIMLPVIIKSTEETLKLIPYFLKEASLALGVPYYKTILKVILPAGFSGILTGILLSIARVSGETAPLLLTAFGSCFMNLDISKPINSLPLLIFNYATSPYSDWISQAWGASLILVSLVLILNIIAKLVVKKWKIQF
ncbi:MAG: phosphate ABC transporter permease PstA [bacterium]